MMIGRATGAYPDAREFKRARRIVLEDSRAKGAAPKSVRVCRDPDSVWSYIKGLDGLSTYESRRQFLRSEFEPLLSALERFESSPLEELVEAEASKLDSASVTDAWKKALERGHRDPAGAITSARALLESVCKTILDDIPTDSSDPYESDDLPKLYARVAAELNLGPADHTDEAIKRILGGCMTAVNGLANLRNRVGDAHGPGRRAYKATPRHAALAVNFAGTTALFLMQTAEPLREYWEEEARQLAEEDEEDL